MKQTILATLLICISYFSSAQLQTLPTAGVIDSLGKNVMKPINDNFAYHQSQIETVNDSIVSLRNKDYQITLQQTANTQSILINLTSIAAHTDSITSLRSDVNTNTGNLLINEDSIVTLNSRVNSLTNQQNINTSVITIHGDSLTSYNIRLNDLQALINNIDTIPNSTPTNITLSADTIPYGVADNTQIATITTTDPDPSDTHVYTLASGTGDTDNGNFIINGNKLLITAATDFEISDQAAIRIRTTDNRGASFEKSFTLLTVENPTLNTAPTDILLSSNSIQENISVGAQVGLFSEVDAETNSSGTFTLVDGAGATHNSQFSITGNQLITAQELSYTGQPRTIRVRYTDDGGLFFEKSFLINVTEVVLINQPPTDYTSIPATLNISEGNQVPYFLGLLTATDPEDQTITYTLSNGTGDTNNNIVDISNDSIYINTTLNYDNGATRTFRATASDGVNNIAKSFTINVIDTILSIAPVQDTSWIHINFTKPGSTYSMSGLTNLDQDTLTVDNLENDQGYSTNVSIELSPNMLPNTSSIYADSNDSLFDAAVYNSAWRGGVGEDSWLIISGLEPNQEYLLWMYSNSATGRIFDINLNGESSLIGFNSSDNNYIIQDEFTADAQGRIRIDFTNVQTILILNYIGIRGLSAFETIDVIQPPSELNAIISNDTTYLTWQDNSDLENKTYIYHKTEYNTLFTKIDSVGQNVTNYEHVGVPSDTLLSYYVVARNDTLLSQASPVVNVERSTAPPGNITNFSATPYQTSISLNWNTTNANTIKVNYTTTLGGSWNEKIFAGDLTTGSISSLSANTPYYIRVRSENNFGISAWSDTLNIVTLSESQRYVIPSYRDEYDFATQIYIDPSASTNGSGTINSPLNYMPASLDDNTAYLIKAGTTINPFPNYAKTWNETYIGRYGSGANPVLIGTGLIFQVNEGTEGFCLHGLDIRAKRNGASTAAVLNMPGESYTVDRHSPIEVTYCKIQGIADPNYGYPLYIIKSDIDILYHCEVSHSSDDLWFTGSLVNAIVHSNYFHHANIARKDGDCMHVQYTLQNTKYVNNLLDRRGTDGKFCLIINQVEGPNYGNEIKYNTMFGADPGYGGAVMQLTGSQTIATKNIFVRQQDWLFNTWTSVALEAEPYGIRDNVYISPTTITTGGNFNISSTFYRLYSTIGDYIIWQQQNPDEFYGSDIDPNNFWNQ